MYNKLCVCVCVCVCVCIRLCVLPLDACAHRHVGGLHVLLHVCAYTGVRVQENKEATMEGGLKRAGASEENMAHEVRQIDQG